MFLSFAHDLILCVAIGSEVSIWRLVQLASSTQCRMMKNPLQGASGATKASLYNSLCQLLYNLMFFEHEAPIEPPLTPRSSQHPPEACHLDPHPPQYPPPKACRLEPRPPQHPPAASSSSDQWGPRPPQCPPPMSCLPQHSWASSSSDQRWSRRTDGMSDDAWWHDPSWTIGSWRRSGSSWSQSDEARALQEGRSKASIRRGRKAHSDDGKKRLNAENMVRRFNKLRKQTHELDGSEAFEVVGVNAYARHLVADPATHQAFREASHLLTNVSYTVATNYLETTSTAEQPEPEASADSELLMDLFAKSEDVSEANVSNIRSLKEESLHGGVAHANVVGEVDAEVKHEVEPSCGVAHANVVGEVDTQVKHEVEPTSASDSAIATPIVATLAPVRPTAAKSCSSINTGRQLLLAVKQEMRESIRDSTSLPGIASKAVPAIKPESVTVSKSPGPVFPHGWSSV